MEHWIKELLVNLDATVDEKTKQNIMEKCGVKCPFSHMPNDQLVKLRKEIESETEFLKKLGGIWHLREIDGQYYVIFDKCYCPLAQKDLQSYSKNNVLLHPW